MASLEGTDMDPTAIEHTLVIATNHGKLPFRARWNKQWFQLDPGVPTNIPYLAMCLWFGNPKLRDMSRSNPDLRYRSNEVERLAGKYGIGADAFYKDPVLNPDAKTSALYDDPTWDYIEAQIAGRKVYKHPNLPNVSVSTYDGTRIVTVIDDPEGAIAYPERSSASSDEVEQLRQQAEVHRQQIQMLMSQIGNISPEAREDVAVAFAPTLASGDTVADAADLPTFPDQVAESNSQTVDPVTAALTKKAPSKRPSTPATDTGMTSAIESDPAPVKRASKHTPNK